jgi:hypothetical protein
MEIALTYSEMLSPPCCRKCNNRMRLFVIEAQLGIEPRYQCGHCSTGTPERSILDPQDGWGLRALDL